MTADTNRRDWDAIVVGSGLGGLTCAAMLGKGGKRVLVLERHDKVGGYAHQFMRKAGPDTTYRFDVALHLVFVNLAAHDKYQSHPRHLEFVEKNKQLWESVRVFDSYLVAPPRKGG